MQVILTGLAAFRQQVVPCTHRQICDYQDEAVLGTLNARLLLARSRTYRRTRDQYRDGGPPHLHGPPTSGPYPKQRSGDAAHYLRLCGTDGGMVKINRWQVYWTLSARCAKPRFALKPVSCAVARS